MRIIIGYMQIQKETKETESHAAIVCELSKRHK